MNSSKPIKTDQSREYQESMGMSYKQHVNSLRENQGKIEQRNQQTCESPNKARPIDEPNNFENDTPFDEIHELMTIGDPTMASILLNDIYRQHDLEDLTYRFLPSDSLDQDKVGHAVHGNLNFDPDAICDANFT